jgi:GNAT superfamily N-acetyltransferase
MVDDAVGFPMRLRIARARDRLAVRAFLDRLSPATIQGRYLSQHTSLSGLVGDREVARMLDGNAARHVVLLAVQGAEVRGIGEFVGDPVKGAEVSLVVEDAFQGRGVGRRLLRKLEQLALRRGIRAFTGDLAYSNTRMLALLHGSGRRLQLTSTYGSQYFRLQL